MDTALAFSDGYALHAMDASFKLELPVCFRAAHGKDDLLKAADFIWRFADQFYLISAHFGPTGVHAVQFASKQARLVAAGSGTDLDNDVAVVVGILRCKHVDEFGVDSLEGRIELVQFFLGKG